MTLRLGRVLAGYFVECPFIWVCLTFFSWLGQGYGVFLKKYHRSELSLSCNPIDSTGDVNFDTWLKECLPGFLTIKLLFFSKALHFGWLVCSSRYRYVLLPCPIHASPNLALPTYLLDHFPILVFWWTIHRNTAPPLLELTPSFNFTFEILRLFLGSGQMLLPS